jgi:hypothetical protein
MFGCDDIPLLCIFLTDFRFHQVRINAEEAATAPVLQEGHINGDTDAMSLDQSRKISALECGELFHGP